MKDPVTGSIQLSRDLFWRAVGALEMALNTARFLDWGECRPEKIFGESDAGVSIFASVENDCWDVVPADQAGRFKPAEPRHKAVAVVVFGHGDRVDQAVSAQAVGELTKLFGIEGEAVVTIVLGFNLAERDVPQRR